MEKRNTVILSGANGYLGSYVARELIKQGYHVIGLTYDHWASVIIDHPSIRYIRCDIRQEIAPQLEGHPEVSDAGAIINAAALLGSSDYDRNYAVNAHGVENLIHFARQAGISRFIQISSVVVLKEVKGPYGETKLIGQQMVTSSGLDYTVFIPAMILGPESLGLNRILKNVFRFPFIVPLIGQGSQTQHPIFVKDFAAYIVKSIPEPVAVNKVYQIAGDRVISFKDFIRMILKIKGQKKIFIPVPPGFAKALGKFFQKTQKVPVFTAEHVKGILQDSNLDTSLLVTDLDFKPTPFQTALGYCLDEIGSDHEAYLKPRPEKVITQL